MSSTLVRCEIGDDHWGPETRYNLGTYESPDNISHEHGLVKVFERYDWRYCGEDDHDQSPRMEFFVVVAQPTPPAGVITVEQAMQALAAANCHYNGTDQPVLRSF